MSHGEGSCRGFLSGLTPVSASVTFLADPESKELQLEVPRRALHLTRDLDFAFIPLACCRLPAGSFPALYKASLDFYLQ